MLNGNRCLVRIPANKQKKKKSGPRNPLAEKKCVCARALLGEAPVWSRVCVSCQLKVIYTDIVLEYPPLRVVHFLPKGVGRKLRFPFFLCRKRSHGRPQIYCKTGIKLSKVQVL
uniref:(northern house mosquito) hypothetical protein n=1 Tax=Culex pipiens TaxID=7175 RepID=A0A8D8FKN6_CULPI